MGFDSVFPMITFPVWSCITTLAPRAPEFEGVFLGASGAKSAALF